MPTYVQRVALQVTAGGQDITEYVLRARVRLDFGLRVPEAEVYVHDLPNGLGTWSPLQVVAGCVGEYASGPVQRFDGYVIDPEHELWPQAKALRGKGQLYLAERCVVPQDEEADLEGLPLAAEYLAPGIDMSCHPTTYADWTDAQMVTWLLQQAGLGARIGLIQGNPHLLGTQAFEQFVWRRGQSALSFIEELDRISCGFRTYESTNGLIYRVKASPNAPFDSTRVDINESIHILPGARIVKSTKDARSRFVVTGFDDGAGQVVAVESIDHVAPPPGVSVETMTFNSPLLERDEPGDTTDGLSCREVAQWMAAEYGQAMFEATVPTWLDHPFVPGALAYLNSPRLAGVMQTLWVRGIEIDVTPNSFTQTLTLRGAYAGNQSWANDPMPYIRG